MSTHHSNTQYTNTKSGATAQFRVRTQVKLADFNVKTQQFAKKIYPKNQGGNCPATPPPQRRPCCSESPDLGLYAGAADVRHQ